LAAAALADRANPYHVHLSGVPLTYDELGKWFGLTREGMRQIHAGARGRLLRDAAYRPPTAKAFLRGERMTDAGLKGDTIMKWKWASPPLAELDLPARVRNPLAQAGVTSVDVLAKCTLDDLMSIRNFGPKALADLERAWEAWEAIKAEDKPSMSGE